MIELDVERWVQFANQARLERIDRTGIAMAKLDLTNEAPPVLVLTVLAESRAGAE
jgi:hypothetical protein